MHCKQDASLFSIMERRGMPMLFVENNNTDPYCNHALEEWLMDHTDEDCFVLWRNQRAILLGKNQNAYNEIDLEYAKAHNIKIVRRITGGGTVFTDEGNVMFTFISNDGRKDFADFQKFTVPIIAALNALGIPAEFSGRNDLTIDGKKFCGNAQCRYKDKVLHHGTLMYNADTSELARALKVREIKLRSKGVSSVQSRVTNISDYMENPMEIEEFRSFVFHHVMEHQEGAHFMRLTPAQWEEVRMKALEKHATDAWIYGKFPQFDIYKETKLPGGIVEVYFNLTENRISKAEIYGDFFSIGDIGDVEKALLGTEYREEPVKQAMMQLDIDTYFKNISVDELVTAMV